MRALIQRVTEASVTIGGVKTSEIEQGFLILLGVCQGDSEKEVDYLVDKCVGMRIFTDENDKMNLSINDIGGALLVVSQFTLYADCRKGKRPSFINAEKPQRANELYEYFVSKCKEKCENVQTGEFGADMKISLINDGPVTIMLDTEELLGVKK